MSELLTAAAQALGVPETLVQRAAEARAAETGMTIDDVLSAWAGGAAMPTTQTVDAPPAPEPTEAEEVEVPAVAAPVQMAAAATPTQQTAQAAPAPAEVNSREAARLPEVITVPTAGIRERTSSSIPRWLTTVMLVVPIFALFALGLSATGECGEATELQPDVVTGNIVNCDGTEFTGQSAGGGGADFVGAGEDIFNGDTVSGVNCSGCHGASGQGGGNFPALTGVLTTFGSCADHIEWVTLGSAGFTEAGRDTYGDTDKAVNGGMPSFGSSLTEEQVAAVVAYERVRFGGGDPAEVGVDCGLVESPEGEPGGTPGTTVPGETTPTTVPGETTPTTVPGETTPTTVPDA